MKVKIYANQIAREIEGGFVISGEREDIESIVLQLIESLKNKNSRYLSTGIRTKEELAKYRTRSWAE